MNIVISSVNHEPCGVDREELVNAGDTSMAPGSKDI